MPIYQSDADKARELISLHADVPAVKQAAEDARNNANSVAGEDYPPEIIAAYQILADEATATAVETEELYEKARVEFAGIMQRRQ